MEERGLDFMKYFTVEEIKNNMAEVLKNYDDYYRNFHDVVLNSNYYADSEEVALEMLQDYGVFEAIRKIQKYEKDRFGEVTTNLGSPQEVANMLYYIIWGEVISSELNSIIDKNWGSTATDETNKEMIKILEEKMGTKIKVVVKKEEILDFARRGEDCKIEIDYSDGIAEAYVLPVEASGFQYKIDSQIIEACDYNEFEEEEDFLDWFVGCYDIPYEATSGEDEYLIKIEFE